MKEILSEIHRISELLGHKNNVMIVEGDESSNTDKYIEKIVNLLKFSGVYSAQNQKNLNKVIEYSKEQIIDFRLLERGLIKTLKLRGDKTKNTLEFFKVLLKSLKKRQKDIFTSQPELDDEPSFEPQEPSVLPKKIYKQELYYLQVELLKLSYIGLKLTYTLGLQVYPLSLNQSNMHSSSRKLDLWDAHLTSLDTSLRLNKAQRRQLKRLNQLLRNS